MTTEPTGRYGAQGDAERCIPAPSDPTYIYRVSPNWPDACIKLQRLVEGTGCTVTEASNPMFYTRTDGTLLEGNKHATVVYGKGDDVDSARVHLASMGYTVNFIPRNKP